MVVVLLRKKLNKLKKILLGYKKVLIAYSGGVDSTFLLKCCSVYLGRNSMVAVTAVSPTYTRGELRIASQIVKELDIRHKIIKTRELESPNFKTNPENRCYYCKKELFSKLKAIARKEHIDFILDGSNLDDLKDYRPGNKAKKEFHIYSPLIEAGFTKKDIRKLSREFGLKTWDAPQAACLASRFAYGHEITMKNLVRVEKAEGYIRSLGFDMVRVRHYELPDKTKLARIEVYSKDIEKISSRRPKIISQLKKLGYDYVTLDLEGYRCGSMNEGILQKS